MDPGLSVDQWLSFGIFEMISLLCKVNLVQPMPAPFPFFHAISVTMCPSAPIMTVHVLPCSDQPVSFDTYIMFVYLSFADLTPR